MYVAKVGQFTDHFQTELDGKKVAASRTVQRLVLAETEEHPEGADRGGEATVKHTFTVDGDKLTYEVSHNANLEGDTSWLEALLVPYGVNIPDVRTAIASVIAEKERELQRVRAFAYALETTTEFALVVAYGGDADDLDD